MLLNDSAVSPPGADHADTTYFFLLRGRAQILRMQAVLISLSALCGQTGAMDYLEYFLTGPENLKKNAHLILAASRSDVDVFKLRAQDLKGVALAYEYKLLGFPSRVFTTSDFSGNRNFIAPPDMRPRLSVLICRYLIENGAQIVLLSFAGDSDENCQRCLEIATVRTKKSWWTMQTRVVGGTIKLEKTSNATLASLGKHTRRNLRYYRRKAEAELKSIFVCDVRSILSKEQLVELNQASTHPVLDHVLERRYSTMKTLEGPSRIRAALDRYHPNLTGRHGGRLGSVCRRSL
jgi:hypothetical protein